MERVQKILSNRGVCSRRKAEDLIAQQKVQVNGVTIGLGDKAGPTDTITVEGKTIQQQKKIYIKFNKPMHCVTAVSDAHKKTVMDFIKIKERIFPVGRLDENTSGLLILTNDGDYANNIMHPRYEINKTYRVSTQRNLSPPEMRAIEKGLLIEGKKTSKATIDPVDNCVYDITIHEGRNRIVRKMFKELDCRILGLQRIKIGKLALRDLRPGQWKHMTSQEIKKVFR